MVARKEAIKENIRNEITLAGAQELMNVRGTVVQV